MLPKFPPAKAGSRTSCAPKTPKEHGEAPVEPLWSPVKCEVGIQFHAVSPGVFAHLQRHSSHLRGINKIAN